LEALGGSREHYELLEPLKAEKRRRTGKHKKGRKAGEKRSKKHKRSKRRRQSSSGSSSSDDDDGLLLQELGRGSFVSDDEGDGGNEPWGSSASRRRGLWGAGATTLMRIRFPSLEGQTSLSEMAPVRVSEAADCVCRQSLRVWLSLSTNSSPRAKSTHRYSA